MISSKRRLPDTDIYAITAAAFSQGRPNVDVVRQVLEAGVKIVQYREKDFPVLRKFHECVAIRELTARFGATFVVNDNVDLALAVGADGVHVGQDDLPIDRVRKLVGEAMIVGLSTHSPDQAEAAVRGGIADYIGVGPIYGTAIKKVPMAAVGLGYLDHVVQHYQIPFVAIGGIKQHNVSEVIAHGATCVCLVSEIVGATDITAKIAAIRAQIRVSRALSE